MRHAHATVITYGAGLFSEVLLVQPPARVALAVMNPSHIAVLVPYEDGSGTLPVVSVKGPDERRGAHHG